MKKLSIAAIIMASLAIAGEIFIFATQKEDSEEIQKKAIMNDYRVYAPVIHDTMSFAGERVPLDIYYVREALDNELIINMYRQSSTVLYFKRANRFFPVIEPILQRNGIPDDFKYLCVIESGLTNATSPAKAQGYWQFLASTGTTYGLEVNDEIDMRNNLEASTEAACKYIKSLYARFHSWSAAAAAYNCGEGGLDRRMRQQGTENYYDTRLNAETSRYVYRILAMKLIMQNPRQYGYHLRRCDLYPPIPHAPPPWRGRTWTSTSLPKRTAPPTRCSSPSTPGSPRTTCATKPTRAIPSACPSTTAPYTKPSPKGRKTPASSPTSNP